MDRNGMKPVIQYRMVSIFPGHKSEHLTVKSVGTCNCRKTAKHPKKTQLLQGNSISIYIYI